MLASDTHLVEIDLLRSGPHTLAVPSELIQDRFDYDYLICVNRAVGARGSYELYPRHLRARLPRIKVPLAGDDPAVILDLQAAVARTHEAGSYADRIDYGTPCVPPLSAEDQAWADGWARCGRATGVTPYLRHRKEDRGLTPPARQITHRSPTDVSS